MTQRPTADRYFPLRAAGFWSNPFRALADAEWADVAVLAPSLVDRFDRSAAHLQILGQMGAGKTTTLLGLEALAQDRRHRVAYEYLAEGESSFVTQIDDRALFLLDEAQRLNDREWFRLLNSIRLAPGRAPRVVLSSHQDLSPRFEAHGLALVTVRIDPMTPAEYRAMLERRLGHTSLPDRPRATLSEDAVIYLLATFGANRRAAEWLLYEAFQQLRAPAIVDADRLRAVRASLSGLTGAS